MERQFPEIGELGIESELENEFVLQSQQMAAKLREKGFNVKKILWEDNQAS
ncbi:hypothetical protein J4212_06305 [Candidatus Woesearchaeota archaeon]|nr:hypothetical protein [Candidatus Woesearchaeota archaeon]